MCMLIWAVWVPPVPADAAISVTLELDRNEATPSDAVRLTVSISGSKSCDAPPEIQGLQPFNVSTGGTSSRVEIVNGQYTAKLQYAYYIQPSSTGKFKIGPAYVKVEGKGYNSNTETLNVVKASTPTGRDDPIFLSASLSKKTAYVEEEVLYVLKLHLRKRVSDISLALPESDHLTFRQLGKPKEYRQTVDGHSYGVVELCYSLISAKPSIYDINPATINLTVYDASKRGRRGLFDDPFFNDPFFRRGRPARVVSDPVKLTVRALPAERRPDDFSGLVGRLNVSASIKPDRLRVGESATLTVQLEGKGNVSRMPDLALPEIDGLKVYADEPAFTLTPGPKGLAGLKVMKWALVPEAAGRYTIPPLAVSFFDVVQNRYETLRTQSFALEVAPRKTEGASKSAASAVKATDGQFSKGQEGPHQKQEVQTLGEDILPIHTAISDLDHEIPFEVPFGRGLWAILLGPILVYAAAYVGIRLKKKSIHSLPAIRAKRAAGSFLKAFQDAHDDPNLQISALRGYINDRFGCALATITADEAARILIQNGVEPNTAETLKAIFQHVEAAIYKGEHQRDTGGNASIRDVIKQIERELS